MDWIHRAIIPLEQVTAHEAICPGCSELVVTPLMSHELRATMKKKLQVTPLMRCVDSLTDFWNRHPSRELDEEQLRVELNGSEEFEVIEASYDTSHNRDLETRWLYGATDDEIRRARLGKDCIEAHRHCSASDYEMEGALQHLREILPYTRDLPWTYTNSHTCDNTCKEPPSLNLKVKLPEPSPVMVSSPSHSPLSRSFLVGSWDQPPPRGTPSPPRG